MKQNMGINGNGPTSNTPLHIGGNLLTEEEVGLYVGKIERCKCCGNIKYTTK